MALASDAFAADQDGQIEVGGRLRTFSVHLPDAATPREGFPVILAFHGGGMQGAGMKRITQLDPIADRFGFIVVYPDGVDKHWNDGRSTIKNPQDDVGFVSALIDELGRRYAVDRGRVYATGISNGALFAERLGCELSRKVAAIAAVAGTLPTDLAPRCRPDRPVAVMQIDGTDDPIMPFAGGAVADFGGRGEGGQVLSVQETASIWARRNGCKREGSQQTLPPLASFDPTRIVRMQYAGCRLDAQVTIVTILGGGHGWPGGLQRSRPAIIGRVSRQIDASSSIVLFFLSLPGRVVAG